MRSYNFPMPDSRFCRQLFCFVALLTAWVSAGMPCSAAEPSECTIRFVVAADGVLKSAGVASSSGSAAFDQEAEKAIRSAVPFGALPEGAAGEVEFKARFVRSDLGTSVTILPDDGVSGRSTQLDGAGGDKPLDGTTLHSIRRRILRHFYPSCCIGCKIAQMRFRIKSDGTLEKLEFVKQTGSASADIPRERAIRDAAPFRPLPYDASFEFIFGFPFELRQIDSHGRIVAISKSPKTEDN